MKITRTTIESTYRMFRLSDKISKIQIDKKLYLTLKKPSGDGKIKYMWNAVDEDSRRKLAIWDFKGAKWSCYGSRDLAAELFGEENILA